MSPQPPSFLNFGVTLTQEQYDDLLETEDSDGYACAQMIITPFGVWYVEGDYSRDQLHRHFSMAVEHVTTPKDDDQE